MKASELRIGNYVYDTLGKVNKIDLEAITYIAKEPHNQVKPIPLTEEWLLKFGFEYDSEVWFNSIALYKCHDGFNYNVNFYEYDNLHTIKYVHQLQNLYFTLTGEELTFKSE